MKMNVSSSYIRTNRICLLLLNNRAAVPMKITPSVDLHRGRLDVFHSTFVFCFGFGFFCWGERCSGILVNDLEVNMGRLCTKANACCKATTTSYYY